MRPKGMLEFKVYRDGDLFRIDRGPNLWVNAGLPALAALLGGDYAGEFASAVGFGQGSAAPLVTNTALTGPAYYKTLDSHSEDGLGSVTFLFSLTTGDTGADGLAITEVGLFSNHTGTGLPGSTAPVALLAHRTFPAINFTTGMSVSFSWTITF